jgi:hypothetical protein
VDRRAEHAQSDDGAGKGPLGREARGTPSETLARVDHVLDDRQRAPSNAPSYDAGAGTPRTERAECIGNHQSQDRLRATIKSPMAGLPITWPTFSSLAACGAGCEQSTFERVFASC